MSEKSKGPVSKHGTRTLAIMVAAGLGTAVWIAFALPAFLVSVVGLLPTVVSLVTDRTPGHRASWCVATTNIAGILPIIAKSFRGDNDLAAATELLVDPINWLVMYVGAGMGWVLLWIGPVIAEVFVAHKEGGEARSLQESQQKLIAEWGRKVLGA